jgi:hypothetical protein
MSDATAMTKISVRGERDAIISRIQTFCSKTGGYTFLADGQGRFRIRKTLLGPVRIVFEGLIPPPGKDKGQGTEVSDILLGVLDARFVPLAVERRQLMAIEARLRNYFGAGSVVWSAGTAADAKLVTILDRAQRQRRLMPEDLAELKRAIVADRRLSRAEMETVCQINEVLSHKTPEWEQFFVNALFLYFAGANRVLTAVEEAQLLDWMHHDNKIDERTELQLMIHVVRRFGRVSVAFNRHMLDLLRKNILTSDRPLFTDAPRVPGVVGADDVIALRRVILGVGSDGGAAVSQTEAAFLIDLDKTTDGHSHSRDWEEFYTQSLLMYLDGESDTGAAAQWLAGQLNPPTGMTANQRAFMRGLATRPEDVPAALRWHVAGIGA